MLFNFLSKRLIFKENFLAQLIPNSTTLSFLTSIIFYYS